MEDNGVRVVIMGLLILGLVVGQIEAKSCCKNTTGRKCFNACRLPGTPRPICASTCDCIIIKETRCPESHPRSSSEGSVYQTIITTSTEFDEPDPSQLEKCESQLSGTGMNSCRHYTLWPSSLLEQECCKELERVNDPQCKCQALRIILEVTMKAEGLADRCQDRELRSCQIRGQQEF